MSLDWPSCEAAGGQTNQKGAIASSTQFHRVTRNNYFHPFESFFYLYLLLWLLLLLLLLLRIRQVLPGMFCGNLMKDTSCIRCNDLVC